MREMVLRDANHPSVIFWNNGNEGGTNPELDREFHRVYLQSGCMPVTSLRSVFQHEGFLPV